MAKGLTNRFMHLLAEISIAVSSVVSPTTMHVEPVQPEKRRKAPTLRDGIGSSDFMNDSKWESIRYFDDRMAIYTALDDMVNFSIPNKNGHFWRSVNYKNILEDGVQYSVLSGLRSDGENVSVRAKVEESSDIKEVFYDLCKELNGGNWVKPISKIIGVDGFYGVEK